jgi:hypothetical protein
MVVSEIDNLKLRFLIKLKISIFRPESVFKKEPGYYARIRKIRAFPQVMTRDCGKWFQQRNGGLLKSVSVNVIQCLLMSE